MHSPASEIQGYSFVCMLTELPKCLEAQPQGFFCQQIVPLPSSSFPMALPAATCPHSYSRSSKKSYE